MQSHDQSPEQTLAESMPEELHIRVGVLDESGPDGLPVFWGYIANAPEPFDGVRFLWVTAKDEVAFGLDSLPTPSGTLPVRWPEGTPQAGELAVERTADGFAEYLGMVAGSDTALEQVGTSIGLHVLVESLKAATAAAGGDDVGDDADVATGFYL